MTALKTARLHHVGIAIVMLVSPACAGPTHHALVRTAPGEEMAFDTVPTRMAPPVSIAMPASAPCHLTGHGPDIVCALVTMDGTYYAAMRSRGIPPAEVVADSATEAHNATHPQVATDD